MLKSCWCYYHRLGARRRRCEQCLYGMFSRKGNNYACNRNYILDQWQSGALEWVEPKRRLFMPEKQKVPVVKAGDVTQRVGVEVIRARGVDVEKLIKMLIANAAAEFASTYYYYTILRMHLAGHEDYKEICEDARLEDRAHW